MNRARLELRNARSKRFNHLYGPCGFQVALAVSKGADVTEMLLARRYCDAYIAVEGLALGDSSAKESILNGLAPGAISRCEG